MNIQFTARHFKPNDQLRQQVTDHLERLAKYDTILHAEAILTEEQKPSHTVCQAEMIVKVFGTMLATKATGMRFPEAVDAAAKKLEAQLMRYKAKHTAKRLRQSKRASVKKTLAP